MSTTKKNSRRKAIALGLAVLGVAGLSLASAAQLNVNSSTVGAGVKVVASCDTDGVDVSYGTAYSATVPGYKVSTVKLSNVAAACAGKSLTIDLLTGDAAGSTSLGTVSTAAITLTGTSTGDLTVTGDVDAAKVKGVAVVIAG